MLDIHDPKTLAPADLTAWMKEVFAKKLADMTRLATVNRTFGRDAEADDDLWDQAAERAWGLLDRDGMNAQLPTSGEGFSCGLTKKEEQATQMMLETLALNLVSEGRTRKNAAWFTEITGQSVTSLFHTLQLREAYIKAMAHAHHAAPSLVQGRDETNHAIFQASLKEILATEAVATSPEGNLQQPHDSTSQKLGSLIASPLSLTKAVCEEDAGKPAIPEPDPTLSAVAERLMAEKRSQELREATIAQYASSIDLFIKITGIQDVRKIDQDVATVFKAGLRKLPVSYGKSPKDRDLSFAELVNKADALPDEKVGLSPTTVNRHIDHLKQILNKAEEDGIALRHKVNTTKLRMKDSKRDRDKRASFRKKELETLFAHSLWTGHRRPERRHEAGEFLIKDGKYWCPLIASVTGARLEEIAALTVTDIGVEDGIYYFSFDENEIRNLKTLASRRRVPIHPALIAIGFLDHVERMRCKKSVAIFPEMAPGKGAKSRYGKHLGYNWRRALDTALDGNPRQLCFHSIRHFVNKAIRDMNDVPKLVRLNILGQEAEDTNDRVYAEDSELPVMLDVISRLPVCWSSAKSLMGPHSDVQS
ncbi:site-specific integrase [Salipiger sp. IMCC34102]|uniref:site-specific integrase n=1 Tax=Salipiger sp. IMCC34102 TaxID=2510647 RepID=UPI00101BB558|nr:site-specific integrase [Salipiger sp. IMCC34102]RYH02008.1 site-specific integrase [Salipiger sp. IMCC34102]